jgi:hypothetical protein
MGGWWLVARIFPRSCKDIRELLFLLLPSTRGQSEQCYSARVRRGGGRLRFSPYSVFKEKKRGEEEMMPFWSNSN